jgi:uncharacterized iron-regulated protein
MPCGRPALGPGPGPGRGPERRPAAATAPRAIRTSVGVTLCAAASLLAACAGGPHPEASGSGAGEPRPLPATPSSSVDGVKLLGQDHVLVGRVWSVRERRFVAPERVEAAVRSARFALLGERHGNPDQHALQARLIAAAGRDGRRAALVAEQLDFEQQPAIDACRRDCPDFGADLGARVTWEKSGWPSYALYRPVFAAAGAEGAPVYAGNAGAKRIRELARGEPPTRDEAPWVARAREPLSAKGRDRLVADLTEGHCGHLPTGYAESLVLAQRLRDASMTATLQRADASAERPDTAVLVAGTGHARRDYGVPTLLGAPALVVGFIEVAEGRSRPADYGPADGFDYLWFTRRVDEPDPCVQFRERLEKLKK